MGENGATSSWRTAVGFDWLLPSSQSAVAPSLEFCFVWTLFTVYPPFRLFANRVRGTRGKGKGAEFPLPQRAHSELFKLGSTSSFPCWGSGRPPHGAAITSRRASPYYETKRSPTAKVILLRRYDGQRMGPMRPPLEALWRKCASVRETCILSFKLGLVSI